MSDLLTVVTFYHGTDIDSALDILNHGLNVEKLSSLQTTTQIGPGWYTTLNVEVAWFFASLAPGNFGRGYTVVEMDLAFDDLQQLIKMKLAKNNKIFNVPFIAAQYIFLPASFDFLNKKGILRPFRK
jgi:hypothetical protein